MKTINNKKKHITLTTILVLFSTMLFATGPSHIQSELRPISINNKNEILCRTKFTKNQTGTHKQMKIEYGLCILTNNTIIQFKTKELDPDNLSEDIFFKQYIYWDSVYMSCFNKENLTKIEQTIKNKYKFNSCNIHSFYAGGNIMSLSEFENNKKINLKNNPQKALNGGLSTNYCNEKLLRVLYDFGKIIILDNTWDEENYMTESLGAKFNYYNTWIDEKGKKQNIGYDISDVTGVLFLAK